MLHLFFERQMLSDVKPPKPIEVIIKEFCRNSLEPLHPLFQAIMKIIDVLNVVYAFLYTLFLSLIDGFVL